VTTRDRFRKELNMLELEFKKKQSHIG